MRIVIAQPPNREAIDKVFSFKRRVIFAWGDAIYNPDNIYVDPPMMAHEEVHQAQQIAIGGPEIWWPKYLTDAQFRLDQELPAYRKQYQVAKERGKTKDLQNYAERLAESLSSDTYGHIINFHEALKLITA